VETKKRDARGSAAGKKTLQKYHTKKLEKNREGGKPIKKRGGEQGKLYHRPQTKSQRSPSQEAQKGQTGAPTKRLSRKKKKEPKLNLPTKKYRHPAGRRTKPKKRGEKGGRNHLGQN